MAHMWRLENSFVGLGLFFHLYMGANTFSSLASLGIKCLYLVNQKSKF